MVNARLTVIEPVLLRQLNLESSSWEFSLAEGESPLTESRNGEKVLMKRQQGGTFSMALVLRAVLVKVCRLLEVLGRDGLLLWVKEWLVNYEKENEGDSRRLSRHMVALENKKVNFIDLYEEDYQHLHLYHPPPDKK